MIPTVSQRPRLTVENSTTTVRKLVKKALVRKNKLLDLCNNYIKPDNQQNLIEKQ